MRADLSQYSCGHSQILISDAAPIHGTASARERGPRTLTERKVYLTHLFPIGNVYKPAGMTEINQHRADYWEYTLSTPPTKSTIIPPTASFVAAGSPHAAADIMPPRKLKNPTAISTRPIRPARLDGIRWKSSSSPAPAQRSTRKGSRCRSPRLRTFPSPACLSLPPHRSHESHRSYFPNGSSRL